NPSQLQQVVIWGNHSATQVPDVSNATVQGHAVATAVQDDEWLRGPFVRTVQQRGAAIIKARGASSAASAANAVLDHVRDWLCGTNGRVVSMAVCSDNNPYGVPEGLIFSFPVTCENQQWRFVEGLRLDAWTQEKIGATAKELIDERQAALGQ
ncbi:MAG: hypothetical protein MHM6MM_008807, partial [Cercozoa sp. M6MM]